MKTYKTILKTQRLKRIEDNLTENDFIFKIKRFVMNIDLSELEKNFKGSKRGPHPIPLWIRYIPYLYAFIKF